MTSSLIVKATRPAKDFTSITQVGFKAYNLALAHQAEIDARLPSVLTDLSQDLDALGVVIPGAVQARHEAVAATAAQNAMVEQGYAHVRAIRQTVRKSGAPKDVQRAYGVGQQTAYRRVRDVKAALQQIVDHATSAPKEAAAFGLSAMDVAALTTFIAQLIDADMTQEKKRAGAPLSTKERNVTANRVLQTAVLIAGTGMRAFVGNATTYESFQALMDSTKAPTKSVGAAKAKEAAAPSMATSATFPHDASG